MASITKHPKGYRVYIRRTSPTGTPVSKSKVLPTLQEARQWARDQEHALDRVRSHPDGQVTIADVINARFAAKPPVPLQTLYQHHKMKADIGHYRLSQITPAVLESWAMRRSASVSPTTVGNDFARLSSLLRYTGPLVASAEAIERVLQIVRSTRAALSSRRIVTPSQERTRRPTPAELKILEKTFNERAANIPMSDIMYFAIATAMRLGEITQIRWVDYDPAAKTIIVRNRKHPRTKQSNDSRIPLISTQLIDPIGLIERQPRTSPRIFPYRAESVTAAFRSACLKNGLTDLRFHDLRHEAVSRLFEMGLGIEHVSLISGHKTWKHLSRYTQLKAETIHAVLASKK